MERRRFARALPAFCLAILSAAAAAAAEREVDVLVVRLSGGASEERYRYMDLPAAARFLSPVAFAARGGSLSFESESSSGLLERGRVTLASRPSGILERVSVLRADPGREPRPSRTVTVAFTLDELLARGGPWSGVPAAWACLRAASDSRWTSGKVWARSAVFDEKTGRITVRVALSK
jgi:hypothetical protein